MTADEGDEDESPAKSPLLRFLTRRGTLEIICVIGDLQASYTEIERDVVISHQTVSRRLERGEALNVWSAELAARDSEYQKLYRLDTVGRT